MDAKSPVAQPDVIARGWRPDRCDRVALVLQGGGALGAYQAGVYQALHEAGIEPDWVSGVSIGAINAAIIAGNPPERRLERLRAFWERITERKIWHYTPDGDLFRQMRAKNEMRQLSKLIARDPLLEQWIEDVQRLMDGDQGMPPSPAELKQAIADIQQLLRGKGPHAA